MSTAARHLLRLHSWRETLRRERMSSRVTAEALYLAECRLREQAAYVIGYCV